MLLRPDGRRALTGCLRRYGVGAGRGASTLKELAWQSIPGSSAAWPRPA
ncbi:hypothetical protein BURMUCGD2M_5172 [Burkholderia multivorans CGD2M]|uniref:Uncharacterized protein n=1 Tax=Burkholderia multivorans CGD2 TaxID=513052 RepID=B9BJC3_9BURK|nr:hypothetical protein BURMUCGD2_5179 [Burkholderia multivorans CGD2]EEE15729.1 hypothetical protein BURMUCGD2M_5172 [Burkholderia multivorans CGD2M]